MLRCATNDGRVSRNRISIPLILLLHLTHQHDLLLVLGRCGIFVNVLLMRAVETAHKDPVHRCGENERHPGDDPDVGIHSHNEKGAEQHGRSDEKDRESSPGPQRHVESVIGHGARPKGGGEQ